jgi:ubiquinone/menaquinone biosynthesis C-methylase UbiE
MEQIRKPFQGVWNIIRFNWHFYVLSIVFVLFVVLLNNYLKGFLHFAINVMLCLILLTTFISLFISWYIYDLSDLYKLSWLKESIASETPIKIININAGFDEMSTLLQDKFRNATLQVFDFYDEQKHTEVSIKRARKAYPSFPGTIVIKTNHLPLQDNSVDIIIAFLAAHEIRNDNERILFFKELIRVLKSGGHIIVTEHLRDTANFFAYNIGFFHFHSKATWINTFKASGLRIEKEKKNTPFISTFILAKDATTA